MATGLAAWLQDAFSLHTGPMCLSVSTSETAFMNRSSWNLACMRRSPKRRTLLIWIEIQKSLPPIYP